jgi:hypothetical protein
VSERGSRRQGGQHPHVRRDRIRLGERLHSLDWNRHVLSDRGPVTPRAFVVRGHLTATIRDVSSRAQRKQAWFKRGASAIASVTEGEVGGYVCPLCCHLFVDIDDLTFEHAPPRALGGREVALTCRPCNSTYGHTIDAEMRRAEDLLDWRSGTLKREISARLAVPGGNDQVNVRTEHGEDGVIRIVGVPGQNDPQVTKAHRVAFDAMVEGPVEQQGFSLSFPAHRAAPANVEAGWLRTAYLIAFAKFGYRYALRPLFDPVREQIVDPAGKHVERFHLAGPTPPGKRTLMSVETPRTLRSVMVVTGRHLVFLPGFNADSDTLYERLGARAQWPPRARSLRPTGKLWTWPSSPELLLDFAEPRAPQARIAK